MSKYDYFIAGKWRNHESIRELLETLRKAGKRVYCFIDNAYDSDGILINKTGAGVEEFMSKLETVRDWQDNPTFRKIYETDMEGLRNAEEFILVFPGGLSSHMEFGAAFGMGKKCFGIGEPEKYETLYLMFDEIFSDTESFLEAKIGATA